MICSVTRLLLFQVKHVVLASMALKGLGGILFVFGSTTGALSVLLISQKNKTFLRKLKLYPFHL
ncbi:putative HR-like lesion-inducer [Helianthus anomalus]